MECIFNIIQSKILLLKWLRTHFIPFPLVLLTAIHIIYAGVFTFYSVYFFEYINKNVFNPTSLSGTKPLCIVSGIGYDVALKEK